MRIETVTSGPFATNAYLVACEETKEAWIIDPAPESGFILTKLIETDQFKPKAILLTHSHWDHTCDAAELKSQFQIPLMVHELDAPNVRKPGSDKLPLMIEIPPVEPDHLFKEGDELVLGTHTFEVIHTPGHSPGGCCFFEPKEKVLISGDTLFEGTIGNLSFPGCSADDMWISLDKLAKLPKETKVYPGHGNPTTIGQESWLPKAKEYFS